MIPSSRNRPHSWKGALLQHFVWFRLFRQHACRRWYLAGQSLGWSLGTLVAGASAIPYTASRTIGQPNFREAIWSGFFEPLGLVSHRIEFIFVSVINVNPVPRVTLNRSDAPLRYVSAIPARVSQP